MNRIPGTKENEGPLPMGCGASKPGEPSESDVFDSAVPVAKQGSPPDNVDPPLHLHKTDTTKLSLKMEDIVAVKASWQECLRETPNLGAQTLALLGDASPDTKQLFKKRRADLDKVGERMTDKITEAIALIEAAQGEKKQRFYQLVRPIQSIGISHVAYGVDEYHYSMFWRALQASLARSLGAKLTDDLKVAWRRFYSCLNRIILSAQRTARVAEQIPPRLTPDAVSYCQSSWHSAQINSDNAETRFWNALYHRAPVLRSLFVEGEVRLCPMLSKLGGIVTHLPHSLRRCQELAELGVLHSFYGVKPVHYTQAGQALVEVLPFVRPGSSQAASWQTFFELISIAMTSDPDEMLDDASDADFPDPDQERMHPTRFPRWYGLAGLLSVAPVSASIQMLWSAR
ncbi:hypothetical protein DIPPA_13520 [Diplonema papillatum]|nr:hypothetical protein DIPPA_13520 [Diplonema papillatum]